MTQLTLTSEELTRIAQEMGKEEYAGTVLNDRAIEDAVLRALGQSKPLTPEDIDAIVTSFNSFTKGDPKAAILASARRFGVQGYSAVYYEECWLKVADGRDSGNLTESERMCNNFAAIYDAIDTLIEDIDHRDLHLGRVVLSPGDMMYMAPPIDDVIDKLARRAQAGDNVVIDWAFNRIQVEGTEPSLLTRVLVALAAKDTQAALEVLAQEIDRICPKKPGESFDFNTWKLVSACINAMLSLGTTSDITAQTLNKVAGYHPDNEFILKALSQTRASTATAHAALLICEENEMGEWSYEKALLRYACFDALASLGTYDVRHATQFLLKDLIKICYESAGNGGEGVAEFYEDKINKCMGLLSALGAKYPQIVANELEKLLLWEAPYGNSIRQYGADHGESMFYYAERWHTNIRTFIINRACDIFEIIENKNEDIANASYRNVLEKSTDSTLQDRMAQRLKPLEN